MLCVYCPTAAPVASMAAQELEANAELAAEPEPELESELDEAEPDEAAAEPDVFGDAEPSDTNYEVPAFREQPEPINDADKKKWKSHNAQRKKEKKELIPFEVWLQNKKDQEERKKKAKFVAMMGGAIAASRRGESRHRLVSISLP